MSGAQVWTCRTCKAPVATAFCPTCGEALLRPHDLTLAGLSHQVVESFTNIDARLLRSLRSLVLRPGALTLAYLQGQRKPYILPLPLFLFANLLFFGVQSLTDSNIFSTPLDTHLTDQMWSGIAQILVAHRLEATHTTLALYAPVFNQAVLLNAKTLVILMVLGFTLLPPLLFRESRQPFVAHVVFSLHLYAFLLLLFCAALGITAADEALGGAGLRSQTLDHVLSIALLTACAAYLYVATRKVYAARGIRGAVRAAVLAVAVAAIVLGYRFVLLPITLYST